jgi:hypothetical protein
VKEVEQVVYQTMIADNGAGGLLSLLGVDITPPSGGTIDTSRILHSFQVATPPSPGITFGTFASPKGQIPRFTREVFVAFNIFAANYSDVAFRLMRLFDGVQHDLSIISGGAVQIGGLSSVFDFEGPDGFDESLEVQKKDLRFRFFAVTKAQNPI